MRTGPGTSRKYPNFRGRYLAAAELLRKAAGARYLLGERLERALLLEFRNLPAERGNFCRQLRHLAADRLFNGLGHRLGGISTRWTSHDAIEAVTTPRTAIPLIISAAATSRPMGVTGYMSP